MKLIEWNLNLRANHSDIVEIPSFVSTALLEEDPDFFVLTEFHKVEKWEEFKDVMADYQLFFTENSQFNESDVCIGIRNSWEDVQRVDFFDSLPENRHPNFLHVAVEMEGRVLNIMGVRIRVPTDKTVSSASEENQIFRLDQLKYLEEQIASVAEPVVIVGDFNNYRRGLSTATFDPNGQASCALWNMTVLQENFLELDYTMHTPEGFSWGGDNGNPKYLCAHDHCFTKGVNLVAGVTDGNNYQGHYLDEFMKFAPEVYGEEGIKGVETPYPDHKMLVVEFEI